MQNSPDPDPDALQPHPPATLPPSPAPSPPALPPRRPRALIVFGVIHLVLTGLGALAMISNIVMMTNPETMAANPVVRVLENDPWYATYYRISMGIGYVVLAVLGVSAIGLLKGKEWARKTTIYWAVFYMASTAYNAWVTQQHVSRPMMEQMSETGDASANAVIQATMAFSLMLGIVFALAYGTLVIIMLNRAKVVAWCRGNALAKRAAV